jgi:hypothetical protein
MQQYDVIFKFNNRESIKIESDGPLLEQECYCFDSIIFVHDHKQIILSLSYLPDDMRRLYDALFNALNNNRQLHSSINQDIGYLANLYYKHEEKVFDEDIEIPKIGALEYDYEEGYDSWVGFRYHLWSHDNIMTWLYNNKNGDIIFEITPKYPYFFLEDKTSIQISYEVWIKSYEPLFVHAVNKNVAKKWLNQVDDVIALLEKKLE